MIKRVRLSLEPTANAIGLAAGLLAAKILRAKNAMIRGLECRRRLRLLAKSTELVFE